MILFIGELYFRTSLERFGAVGACGEFQDPEELRIGKKHGPAAAVFYQRRGET